MQAEGKAQGLGSCTTEVAAYPYYRNARRFIFVDTPGLNNMRASKREVFGQIVSWLVEAWANLSIQLERNTHAPVEPKCLYS